MNFLFLAIVLLDGLVVGAVLSFICERLFGNSPLARLIKLLVSVIGGIAYGLWGLYTLGDTEISLLGGAIIILAPVALLVIILIIRYMYKNDGE